AGLHPQLAIILIGANNFGRVHWDAAMTVPGIEAVVSGVHHRLPGAHILLLGVLPSIRSAWVDEQTVATNAALARHYGGSAVVTFMDVGDVLERNGKADASLYVDPRLTPPEPALHPDAQGMRLIAEAIAPVVARYVK
ncbi:GDSL-type esterase/lipase family protein, partial [Acidocella sp.]